VRIEQGPAHGRRPSVEEKQAYYLHPDGEGYQRALGEAREILDAYGYDDAGYRDAAEWTGFTIRQLRAAIPEVHQVEPVQVEPAASLIARDTPGTAAA